MKRFGLLMTVAACAVLTQVSSASEVYKSQQEAEKQLQLANNMKEGWTAHTIRRGGTSYFSSITREFDGSGRQVGGSWVNNVKSLSGTVAAVPIGDFKTAKDFLYRGKNRSGSNTVLTGKVVSVEIQISVGASTPTEAVMQRSVENLVKVGVPLPAAAGAKPGRINSLLESAKRRFGARNAKARFDAAGGKVDLFLFDCLEEKGDVTFMPATPHGASKEERQKLAKTLEHDKDRGGTTYTTVETDIRRY